MEVTTRGPLPVTSLLWRPRVDAWTLTVVCKATLRLSADGSCPLLAEQPAPTARAQLAAGGYVLRPNDRLPTKPRADVLLVGSGYSPAAEPTRVLRCRLALAGIDKVVEVHCDRWFDQQGQLLLGTPFTSASLGYDRASGTEGAGNPVGREPLADAQGRVFLPNLQAPQQHVASLSDWPAAIGFGPLAAAWPARSIRLSGRAWAPDGWFRTPLPDAFDPLFFNGAPADQQLHQMTGNEVLYLENLHPEQPQLQLRLPGIQVAAMVKRSGSAQSLALRCDTLLIDTEGLEIQLTYKVDIPLQSESEVLEVEVYANGLPPQETTFGDAMQQAAATAALEEDEALPAAVLAAIRGGADNVRETTDLQGFIDTAAAPTPFAPLTAGPAPAAALKGADAEFALPFKTKRDPAAAAPANQADSPWAAPGAAGPQDNVDRQGTPIVRVNNPLPVQPALARPPAPITAVQHVRPPDPLRDDGSPPPSIPDSEEAEQDSSAAVAAPTAVLQLIWYAKDEVARVRENAAWAAVLDALDEEYDEQLDDPSYAAEPGDLDDRREVFEVLASAAPLDPILLPELFAEAARQGGKYAPALVLLAGALQLPFDELASLRALHDAVAPFADLDEQLAVTLTRCQAFVASVQPPCSGDLCKQWDKRIRNAFAELRTGVNDDYLDVQVERTLLANRAYQRRDLLGDTQLRTLFTPARPSSVAASGKKPMPCYLPDELAKSLPMFSRISARIIAELLPREDQYETHPAALRVIALARELPTLSW